MTNQTENEKMKKYKCDCGNSKLEACQVVITITGMPLTLNKVGIVYDDRLGHSDGWEPYGAAVVCASCGKRYTLEVDYNQSYFLKEEK